MPLTPTRSSNSSLSSSTPESARSPCRTPHCFAGLGRPRFWCAGHHTVGASPRLAGDTRCRRNAQRAHGLRAELGRRRPGDDVKVLRRQLTPATPRTGRAADDAIARQLGKKDSADLLPTSPNAP